MGQLAALRVHLKARLMHPRRAGDRDGSGSSKILEDGAFRVLLGE